MRVLLFVLYIFSFSFVFGQKFYFVNYSLKEGLPQSQITSLTEDANGSLWIGTLGGLSKFNGTTFTNYSTNNGLLNNRVTSLDTTNGKLLIGHQNGITIYSKRRFSKYEFNKGSENTNISGIVEFNGEYIIATNGNGLIKFKNKGYQKINLNDPDKNRIRSIKLYKDSIVYLATRKGLFQYIDGKISSVKNTEHLNISGLEINKNTIYITTFSQGIFILNTNTNVLKQVSDENSLRNLVIDRFKNLLIITEQGIKVIKPNKTSQYITEETGLNTKVPSIIYKDKNENIWIGSEGKGLFKLPGIQFQYYDSKSIILTDLITSIYPINKNVFLLGTYDYGLIKFNKHTKTSHRIKFDEIIWKINKIDSLNYLLATNIGLFNFNINSEKIQEIKTLENKSIPTNDIIKWNGKIIICSSNGLFEVSNNKIFKLSYQEKFGVIKSFYIYKNSLYLASENGVFSISRKNKITHHTKTKNVQTVSVKSDVIWFGTENGLYKITGEKEEKISLSKSTGSSYINFITHFSDYSEIYIGTNDGLYKIKEPKKPDFEIIHYGLDEGLMSLETNINSCVVTSNKSFVFGTAEGLVFYDRSKDFIEQNIKKPILNISHLKLNYKFFDYSKFSTKLDENGLPKNLKIPYSKNNLTIELDANLLAKSNVIKYRYKLENYNSDWINENTSQISLTNLPYGNFKLYIQAVNGNNYSDTFIIDLEVNPPYYKTWWFFLLIGIIIGGIIFIMFIFQLRIQKRKNEKEKIELSSKLLILEQESLNASMNRHFIFNSLNSIQYYINTQDKKSANKYLSDFAKLIRKNLDSGASTNNMVTLEDEIERIKLYLTLEKMRFQDRFEYQIITNDIDLENILIPSMIFQPFIENSIMHGVLPRNDNNGLIKIIIQENDNLVEIIIEDNGIGYDESKKSKKIFEKSHVSRGVNITSKRIDVLKEISNENYELFGPTQIYNKDGSIKGTVVLLKVPNNF